MSQHETRTEWQTLGPNDPPIDFAREEAAYERERERLIREHVGKVALIHGDEVVGVFATADEAILEGFHRFGTDRTVVKEIRDPDGPDFISMIDLRHPSVKLLE
jgi:hypothetical protein